MTDLPITATTTSSDQRWVLNPTLCHIKSTEGKGRGVFATQTISPRTVIEVSPVLLFGKQEYNEHGKHTVLDHYTFNWKDGRMALALGLGSLFNHAEKPNVSFSVDIKTECIVFTSARAIQPDEELCIFYGHRLWFDPIDGPPSRTSDLDEDTDPWKRLAGIYGQADDTVPSDASRDSDIVTEDNLPFTWKKLGLDKEEEQLDDIELVQAWVVDIPDQTHIASMLKWLKQSGLDKDTLSHLKRVRRQASRSTLLLDTSEPPTLPPSPPLEPPYQLPVPRHPALTPTSLALKNTFWPTIFAPRRKWEPEQWTSGHVRWASNAMRDLKHAYAQIARNQVQNDELPVVAHVPIPYQDSTRLQHPFFAYDTRKSTDHPLRHAVLDLIRQVAEYRGQQPPTDVQAQNGAQYLLTGLSLFITHEPCIMCTMALLHSRVKEVFYLVPIPKTGGCGGLACIPSLKGVNHRFSIAVWKESKGENDWPGPLDPSTDV